MISGIFHPGSGLGNQLHRYVATRVIAADNNYTFGMVAPEHFKGSSFMNIDMGEPVDIPWTLGPGGAVIPDERIEIFEEKKIVVDNVDIRGYDPEVNFIQDGTLIDGEFQDARYFIHRIKEIDGWLRTARILMPDKWCVIGFRGGEFAANPDLFLTREYWEHAISLMLQEQPNMQFVAVTDDPATARAILPDFVRITHDIGTDWRMVRYARYLIIANSSFYILPALLNWESGNAAKIIAPRYWARRNTGVWALPQNYYRQFTYI